jgi:ABC-type uncharacterized transport system involved in gliding motility auxiliary subunit
MKLSRKEIFITVAYAGSALLAGGFVRYNVQQELTTANKALMISGGVLLLAALIGNFREVFGFFGSRGGKLGTNTLALVLGFAAILGLLNFLSSRHSKRWDWTPEKLYTLSDETKKVAGGLKQTVRVIRFDKKSGPDPLRDTMTEYRKLSSEITYETVDPQERPDVAKEYGVRRMGEVVLASGTRTEHLKDTDEQSLTNGILKVTSAKQKTVCFVQGHGEKSLKGDDAQGYSRVQQGLEGENYAVKPVNLVEAKGVPSDCDVLVVAGPKTTYFPEEVQNIQKYLSAGGKALVMVDPETDPQLGALLADWNIALGNNIVLDVSGMGQIIGAGPAVPLVTNYGSHAITEGFQNQMTFFPLARTVAAADKKKSDPQVTELLLTSERSFAKNNFDPKQKELSFVKGKDDAGPLTLGVATQRTEGAKSARLVVMGNSSFADNAYFKMQRNGDLFLNTVNWLALDENLISIRPKSPTNRRLTFTAAQQTLFYWFSLVFLPGIVIVTGGVLWWKRR